MPLLPVTLEFYTFTLVFWVSMYGWGRLVTFRATLGLGFALTTVFGLGVVCALGGVLNMLQLATGGLLNALLVLGVLCALPALGQVFRERRERLAALKREARWLSCFALFVAALVCVLTYSTLIPEAYNYHDDYQKYVNQPLRMIATGSLFGSPLSCAGKEVLGGQALFQAFFVQNLGLEGLNAFDSFFSLLLAVVLVLEQGLKRGAPGFALMAAGLLAMIHPQYVNTSALYSAALLMTAAVFLTPALIQGSRDSRPDALAPILGLSFCYATIVALKSAYAPFPAVHMAVICGLLLAQGSPKLAAKLALSVTVVSLLLVAPWTSWTLEQLASSPPPADSWALSELIASDSFGEALPQIEPDLFGLKSSLSPERAYYGGTPLVYTSLALFGLLGGALSLFFKSREEPTSVAPPPPAAEGSPSSPTSDSALEPATLAPEDPESVDRWANDTFALAAAGFTAALAYLLILITVCPRFMRFNTTLRYAIPFLIGLVPAALLLLLTTLRSRPVSRRVLVGVWLIWVVSFTPEAFRRLLQGISYGSTLAFPTVPFLSDFRAHNREVLDGTQTKRVATWQEHVPAGKRLIAWTDHAFLFDFKRNPVFEIDDSGLTNPWAVMPEADYLIWEFAGYATRTPETLASDVRRSAKVVRDIRRANLAFYRLLEAKESQGLLKVIYQDARAKVYQIQR